MCARPSLAVASPTCAGSLRIERARQAGLDVAEGAGARAGVAHDHEGGVLLLPALADIRAAGLLAHGVQAVGAHDGVRLDIAGRHRRLDADPVGLLGCGGIRPMRLFRMARARVVEVEDDGHGPYLRLPRVRRKAAMRRSAHQARRIARQISRKTMAPMVAVIRLPQKSGMTCRLSFSNRKPPTMAPTRPTARLPKMPPRPPRMTCASQPAIRPMTIQADDAHDVLPRALRRLRRHAVARRRGGNLQFVLVHVGADIAEQRRRQIALAGVGQHGENGRAGRGALGDFERAGEGRAGGDADEDAFLLRQRLGCISWRRRRRW